MLTPGLSQQELLPLLGQREVRGRGGREVRVATLPRARWRSGLWGPKSATFLQQHDFGQVTLLSAPMCLSVKWPSNNTRLGGHPGRSRLLVDWKRGRLVHTQLMAVWPLI